MLEFEHARTMRNAKCVVRNDGRGAQLIKRPIPLYYAILYIAQFLNKYSAALPNFVRRHYHYALRTSHYALKS